jgi:hypothetical protein
MLLVQAAVGLVYYLMIAVVVVVLVSNFIRTRRWQEEVLYALVLLPFMLRLLRLK